MVAPVLHLDKGAGAIGEAGGEMGRRLSHGHDVRHAGALGRGRKLAASALFSLPTTRETSFMARKVPELGLGRAAGDDDARIRAAAGDAADLLSGPDAPPRP